MWKIYGFAFSRFSPAAEVLWPAWPAMAIKQRGLQRIPSRQEKWYIQAKYCMIWDKSQWYASITQTQTASRSASDCRRMPLRTSLGSAVTGSCQIHRNGPEPGNGAGENRAGLHETVAERPGDLRRGPMERGE